MSYCKKKNLWLIVWAEGQFTSLHWLCKAAGTLGNVSWSLVEQQRERLAAIFPM